jgi:RecA-family ATPase
VNKDNVTQFPGNDKPDKNAAEVLLSQHLRLRQNGYVTTPDKGRQCFILGWPDICRNADEAKLRDLLKQYPDHTNIGIMSIGVLPIDIDVDDKTVVKATEDFINRSEGPSTLKRYSGSQRRLLLYGWKGSPKTRQVTAYLYGEKLEVEIPAAGKFTAFGTHPSGKPYSWEGKSPLDFPRDQLLTFGSGGTLLEMDEARLKTLFEGILGVWKALGAKTLEEIEEPERRGEKAIGGEAKDRKALTKVIMENLRNNYPSRHDWFRIGQAAYNELGEEAHEIWVKFSHQWPGNDSKAIETMWKSFKKPQRPGMPPLIYKTLIDYAQQQGWEIPREFRASSPKEEPFAVPVFVNWRQYHGKAIPEKPFLVDVWVPADEVSATYGDPGVNKTTVALQLQKALELHQPWLGLRFGRSVTSPIPTLGVYCEEAELDLVRRMAAINAYYGSDFDGMTIAHALPRRGHENMLGEYDKAQRIRPTKFYKWILEQALDLKVKLIILDHLSHVYPGDENDKRQVAQFSAHILNPLSLAIGGAVKLLGHPSRAGQQMGTGTSGTVGWEGLFRARDYMTIPMAANGEPEDRNARHMQCWKNNWAPWGGELRLHWHNGVLVPDQIDEASKPSVEDVFLMLLDRQIARGENLSAVPGPNYAATVFSRMSAAENWGYSKDRFSWALNQLLEVKHALMVEDYVHDYKPRKRLVRRPPENPNVAF